MREGRATMSTNMVNSQTNKSGSYQIIIYRKKYCTIRQISYMNLCVRLDASDVTPALGSLLRMKRIPNTKELDEFERDPDAALLSLAINSGLHRYSYSRALFGKGNVINENDPTFLSTRKRRATKPDLHQKSIDDYDNIHGNREFLFFTFKLIHFSKRINK